MIECALLYCALLFVMAVASLVGGVKCTWDKDCRSWRWIWRSSGSVSEWRRVELCRRVEGKGRLCINTCGSCG